MATHQAIIPSYRKDFPWLPHCLRSLRKYATGYLPPVVHVATEDEPEAKRIVSQTYPEATVAVRDGRPGQGFMRAQVAMMSADLYCPKADVIHLIGSDCIATRPFDASVYADPSGKPYVLYTPYSQVGPARAWLPGVERVLGISPEFEFMRRLPSVFPASIFQPMRDRVEQVHRQPFEHYIFEGDLHTRNTSEANILGAFAFHFMPETCRWVFTPQVTDWSKYPSPIGQNWSHGGLDHPQDAIYEYEFRGEKRKATGLTARTIISELLYDGGPLPA